MFFFLKKNCDRGPWWFVSRSCIWRPSHEAGSNTIILSPAHYPLSHEVLLGCQYGSLATSTGECNLLACPGEEAKHVAGAPSFGHLRNPKGGQNDSSNVSRQAKQRRRPSKSHCPVDPIIANWRTKSCNQPKGAAFLCKEEIGQYQRATSNYTEQGNHQSEDRNRQHIHR
jgi:hypothetical protein